MFDVVAWALYGETAPRKRGNTFRGLLADEVVCEDARGDCFVAVDVEDGGVQYRIERWRKVPKGGYRGQPSGVALLRLDPAVPPSGAWADLSRSDAKDTQADVDALLGMDVETFFETVLFGQGDARNFADATDGQRKEILTRILRLSAIDAGLSRVRAELAGHDQKVSGLAGRKREIEANLATLRSFDFAAEIAKWEDERRLAAEDKDRQAAAGEVTIAEHRKAVGQEAGYRTLKATYEERIAGAKASLGGSEPLRVELRALDDEIGRLQGDVARSRGAQDALRRQRAQSEAALREGACPTCRQPVTDDVRQHVHGSLDEQIAALENAAGPAATRVAEAQRRRVDVAAQIEAAAKAAQVSVEGDSRKLGLVDASIREIDRIKRVIAEAERGLGVIRREAADIRARENPYAARQRDAEARVAEAEKALRVIEVDAASAEAERAYIAFWEHGFGARGLRSFVFDSVVRELTDEVNRYLRVLTDGSIWVTFDTERMGADKKPREVFDVVVRRMLPDGAVRERSYERWSGGEKRRIALAIDLGLAGLVARRATKACGLLVLDEVFAHCDAEGHDRVIKLLHEMARGKESVFVVDHSPAFQARFEKVVWVEKWPTGSVVRAA